MYQKEYATAIIEIVLNSEIVNESQLKLLKQYEFPPFRGHRINKELKFNEEEILVKISITCEASGDRDSQNLAGYLMSIAQSQIERFETENETRVLTENIKRSGSRVRFSSKP